MQHLLQRILQMSHHGIPSAQLKHFLHILTKAYIAAYPSVPYLCFRQCDKSTNVTNQRELPESLN